MSSVQKRIYFIQQFDKASTAYNMPAMLKLSGAVDTERLRISLQEMVRRHEILRTDFVEEAGALYQCIRKEAEAEFSYSVDTESSEQALLEQFVRPFDLSNSPLVRMCLVERKEGEYLLLVDMHHIVSDGMSMGIFIREYTRLYNGEGLEALTHQYKDYSEWLKVGI